MVPLMVGEMVCWAVAGFIGSVCADDIYDRLNKKSADKHCTSNSTDDDIVIDEESGD